MKALVYEGPRNVRVKNVHENLGQVIEVGEAVQIVKKGDMVCLPSGIR